MLIYYKNLNRFIKMDINTLLLLEYKCFVIVKNKYKYLWMELSIEEMPLVCTKMAAFVMAARVMEDIFQVERVLREVA